MTLTGHELAQTANLQLLIRAFSLDISIVGV